MGLFNTIFGTKPKEVYSNDLWGMLTAYSPIFTTFDGNIYESELVRASIDARARHISKLQIECKGSAKQSLQTNLKKAPNGWQTWSQFLYRTSTILDATNTCFIVPVLDTRYNNEIGLASVYAPHYELVDVHGVPWIRFEFNGGKVAAMELSRVGILTKYQFKNDYFGEDNRALNSTMQLIDVQNKTIEESAKNASSYSFTAELTNFVKDEDLKKEREAFTESNLKQGSGILLFPNRYKNIQQVKATTFSLDADQMNMIEKNVFNYFGVNEKIIQNSAMGDELDAFFNGAIEPFEVQLSEVLTKMLFTSSEQAHGSKIVANANRLQYMTATAKSQLATMAQQMGMMTINEYRELFNYPPLDDKIGNQIPVRGEYYDASTGEKLGAKEEEDGTQQDNPGQTE